MRRGIAILPAVPELIDRIKAGQTLEEIGEEFGKPMQAVRHKLSQNGYDANGDERERRDTFPAGLDRPFEFPAWYAQAVCASVDPELFFRTAGPPVDAKRICNGVDGVAPCPVRTLCLTYALENDEVHGVWGGLSGPERQQLKKNGAAR